jgi:nicotinamide mononucleotide transporter
MEPFTILVGQLLDQLLAPLHGPLGLTTSAAEVGGFISGVITVYLCARGSIWNWPISIVNNLLWLVLFAGVGLYADAGLQVAYLGLSVYGWFHWLRGGPTGSDDLPVTRASRRTLGVCVVASILGILVIHWLLETQTSSTVPLADATTTTLSLVASWLLARKHIETWPLWIAGVNIPFIAIYLYKGLGLTASLQLVFIVLSVMGWVEWRRRLGGPAPATPSPRGALAS